MEGIEGIQGVGGFPPGLWPSQGPEEEAEEDQASEPEKEEGRDAAEDAHHDIPLLKNGERGPKVTIVTRAENTAPTIPDRNAFKTICARKLWQKDKGDTWHTGLHPGVWTPMLKSTFLPLLLAEVLGFLQHQLATARTTGQDVDLCVDIWCTHGKHRSVGFAVMLENVIRDVEGLNVEVEHLEKKNHKWPCFRKGDCKECQNTEEWCKEMGKDGLLALRAMWTEVKLKQLR